VEHIVRCLHADVLPLEKAWRKSSPFTGDRTDRLAVQSPYAVADADKSVCSSRSGQIFEGDAGNRVVSNPLPDTIASVDSQSHAAGTGQGDEAASTVHDRPIGPQARFRHPESSGDRNEGGAVIGKNHDCAPCFPNSEEIRSSIMLHHKPVGWSCEQRNHTGTMPSAHRCAVHNRTERRPCWIVLTTVTVILAREDD
jgi:hypothetical protein